MACLPDRVWRYSRSCGLFFERKCFLDRLGLGPVLPLYLDNDPFGVGMHAVSYFLIRRRMATDKVHLLLVPDVDLILQDSSLLSESHETPF